MHRQRAGRVKQCVGAGGDGRHGTGGVQQRGGLAHDAPGGENDAGQDARHGRGQHDGEDGAQLARAQTEAALPVGIRHCHKGLLGGAHDEGQHHDGQRAPAGQQRQPPSQPGDKEQHAEQAEHDGGDALQGLGGDAHHPHQFGAAGGVLHQPDGGEHAQRRGDDQREGGHQHGVDEGGHQRHVVGGVLPRKQAGFQVGHALHKDVPDEQHQHGGGGQRGQTHQPAQHGGLHPGGGAVAPTGGQHHAGIQRRDGRACGDSVSHGCQLLSRRKSSG